MTTSRLFDWLGDFVVRFCGPRLRLARSSNALRKQLTKGPLSDDARRLALPHYINMIGFAARLGPEQITILVREFDPTFGEVVVGEAPQLRKALAVLQPPMPPTIEILEAALRLCRLVGDKPAQHKVLQQLCLLVACTGHANGLLAKLFDRHKEGSLTKDELHAVVKAFLKRRSFEGNLAWSRFFTSLPEALLPPLHQVYAALDRQREAADFAEAAGDWRSAVGYWMRVPGTNAALHALELLEKLSDSSATIAAHLKAAECLWVEGKFAEAAAHFQESDQTERASDCQRRLGHFAAAIQMRPTVPPVWLLELRGEVEGAVRAHLSAKEFTAAAQLLRGVGEALRAKPIEPGQSSEAARTSRLLSEVVKTGRAALEAEVRATQAQLGAEVFKRWSLMEEAAGNSLEAGLQAEMAGDYFAASLLFEKAGAFGQALSALGQTAQGAEPKRRAELLERGGDFFMAGLLYERLGETNKAIIMFEEAQEFARAAELRRKQVGDSDAGFDDRWLELLIKAGRVESLAEFCLTQARTPGRPAEDQARLFRRIKQLAERRLVGPKWLDQVAAELPKTEAANKARFDRQVTEWAAAATRATLETYLPCFGMDLGTSNSVVVLFNKKTSQTEVVEWRGRQTIPSVFAVDQAGREIIGIPESELLAKSPRAIVTRAKRMMGTDDRFKVDGQLLRPEEISARFISHGRALAGEQLCSKIAERISALASHTMGVAPPADWITTHLKEHPLEFPLNQAVITVPAYFNDAQKQATRTAATLANITVLRLIHEPTAACLAQRDRSAKQESVVVVDLGAGTLDLSFLNVSEGLFEVAEIEGDNKLGSSDLDDLLYAHFVEVVKKEAGSETIFQGLTGRRLHQASEEMKIELSSHTTWTLKLPHLVGNKTVELSLQRAELERLAAPWLNRIQDACRKIKGRPDRVLLIGGGALMPAVRRCVKEVFGGEPSPGVDPLTDVARGAALQAAILAGELKDLLVLDAVPFSLGIKSYVSPGQSKYDPLIPKHSTIPKQIRSTYTTVADNQPAVSIEVFQGEDPKPEKNFKIGQFRLEGILPAKAGVPKIEVTFEIDANCLLCVTARDIGTNRERQITIADSHLLSPAQVTSLQQRLRETHAHQERFDRLEKLAAELAMLLRETVAAETLKLQRRFRELLQHYETHMAQYAPLPSDNEAFLEVYRDRNDLESNTRLVLDRWETLGKSGETWLTRRAAVDLRIIKGEQLDAVLNEGDTLLRRIRDGSVAMRDVTATYRRWTNVLQELPVNPEGNAEDLARHFLRLARHEEALSHFRRLGPATTRRQVELGLEIIARKRERAGYIKLFTEHSELLSVTRPDFVRLNQSVKTFSSSVMWIQQQRGTGSGFAVGPNEVATNRHVITNDSTGSVVSPHEVRVVCKHGIYRVTSIHVPASGRDDVAILRLAEEAQLLPLNLGFSELVEVGERILTLGFPAPSTGGFEENLYCNVGLVNRIRPSELCSERVLEVSIELQGGISGAPILNELGEVVGLVTFAQLRPQAHQGGQVHFDRSFYAIPVEVLRRLRTEISDFKR